MAGDIMAQLPQLEAMAAQLYNSQASGQASESSLPRSPRLPAAPGPSPPPLINARSASKRRGCTGSSSSCPRHRTRRSPPRVHRRRLPPPLLLCSCPRSGCRRSRCCACLAHPLNMCPTARCGDCSAVPLCCMPGHACGGRRQGRWIRHFAASHCSSRGGGTLRHRAHARAGGRAMWHVSATAPALRCPCPACRLAS